jgi:hypothetical protein
LGLSMEGENDLPSGLDLVLGKRNGSRPH